MPDLTDEWVNAVTKHKTEEMKKILKKHGGSTPINTTIPGDHSTALHQAARYGWNDLVRVLLKNGATVDATDEQGRTALHLAAKEDKYDAVKLLLDWGASVNRSDNDGRTPLQYAAEGRSSFVIAHLINRGAEINANCHQGGKTALQTAIAKSNSEMVQLFLENGADIEADGNRQTVLMTDPKSPSGILLREHREKLTDTGPRRRLIVCCDGTWQENDTDRPLSNVARISLCFSDYDRQEPDDNQLSERDDNRFLERDENRFLERDDNRFSESDHNPYIHDRQDKGHTFTQIVHYQSGVGTSPFILDNLYEAMHAKAISGDICEAYGFICDNLSHREDEIILFGFSRGAFTVRALASLIHDVGVLRGGGRFCMSKVYDLWERSQRSKLSSTPQHRMGETKETTELNSYLDHLLVNHLSQKNIKIKACAVWDTVAALGAKIPRRLPQLRSRKLALVGSKLSPNIENAFQALALDEKRFHFEPKLWVEHDRRSQTLKQCWFLGSHGDVGGGIPNFGLSNLSLIWMIAQLSQPPQQGRKFPLARFDPNKISHLAPDLSLLPNVLGNVGKTPLPTEQSFQVSNSMTLLYRVGGSKTRKPGQKKNSNEKLHISVRKLGRVIVSDIQDDELSAIEMDILQAWKKQEGNMIIVHGLCAILDEPPPSSDEREVQGAGAIIGEPPPAPDELEAHAP